MLEAIAGPALLRRATRGAAARGYLWHEFGDVHLLLREAARLEPAAAAPGDAAV